MRWLYWEGTARPPVRALNAGSQQEGSAGCCVPGVYTSGKRDSTPQLGTEGVSSCTVERDLCTYIHAQLH